MKFSLKPALKIEPPEWMKEPSVLQVMNLLDPKQESKTLFVGGCIRNTLIDKAVDDIDIATTLTPDQVIEVCNAAQVKVIPTGIKHGTVTILIEGKAFEVTTLRHDLKTDGRHAEVAFTNDWQEDIKRRDFTMNSLLADLSGHIYDLTGRGIKDTQAGKVIFVGDPVRRIAEDYLRILRFFRFYAHYGRGEADGGALNACYAAADKIESLSKERITQEFFKILESSKAPEILELMFEGEVLSFLKSADYIPLLMKNFCNIQKEYDALDIVARLFILSGCKARLFENSLKLSHAQKNFLIRLEVVANAFSSIDEKAVKKAIFYHGNKLIMQGYLIMVAKDELPKSGYIIDILKNWQAPLCPITGQDLINEGYKSGPELGQELARRQEEWLEENF